MKLISRSPAGLIAAVAMVGLGACSSSSDDPNQPAEPTIQLAFTPTSVSFGEDRSRAVELRNTGDEAAGPVELVALGVTDGGGNALPGASLSVSPSEVATLNAGVSRAVTLTLDIPGSVGSGDYEVDLEARVGGEAAASLGTTFTVVQDSGPVIETLEISGGAPQARQGEVLELLGFRHGRPGPAGQRPDGHLARRSRRSRD